jgi:DNA polymerase III sliding clamp (beta) subunit (PCNA family)
VAVVVRGVVDRAALLAALEAMPGDAVLLTAAAGRVVLVRRDEEVVVPARFAGPSTSVAFDPGFAADAVRAAVGPEVVIEIVDALRPVVFRTADGGTCTTMLMPIRLA